MSYFAQRDGTGKIKGLFRCLQPQEDGTELTDGIELADNNAEVLAFLHPTPTQDERAQLAVDIRDRLDFEVNFDQENRIRALESKAPITRAQYRDALITRWKQLNQ